MKQITRKHSDGSRNKLQKTSWKMTSFIAHNGKCCHLYFTGISCLTIECSTSASIIMAGGDHPRTIKGTSTSIQPYRGGQHVWACIELIAVGLSLVVYTKALSMEEPLPRSSLSIQIEWCKTCLTSWVYFARNTNRGVFSWNSFVGKVKTALLRQLPRTKC